MELLVAIGLVITGFYVLLATFATLGRFGINPVKAGLLLLLMAFVSRFIGPIYDMLLWTIIQYIITVIWFLYYPKDPLASSRVFGPLVMCTGVFLSALILVFLLGLPVTIAFAALGSTVSGGADIGEIVGAAVGIVGVYLVFGRRIRERWRLGADALRALDAEKTEGTE